jgi:hypothetical protein
VAEGEGGADAAVEGVSMIFMWSGAKLYYSIGCVQHGLADHQETVVSRWQLRMTMERLTPCLTEEGDGEEEGDCLEK